MTRREELDAALQKKPFVPFQIVTAEKTYDITERDVHNICLYNRFVFIGIRAQESDYFFTGHEDVPFADIVQLVPMTTAASAG